MAGEAESGRLHGVDERKDGRLPGGESERALGHEDELRVSSPRSHSSALASDDSFRSTVASSPSPSSSSSLCSDVESADGGGLFPCTQSEYKEIPSFRWIASPLRWWRTRKRTHSSKKSSPAGAPSRSDESGPTDSGEVEPGGQTGTELVHFDGHQAFTLEDLMEADAEVLGRGTHGTLYLAMLAGGNQVAVRRIQWEAARNFEAEVTALGKIRHPNVLALRAYYLWPEVEKVLVFDYMPKGSLSAFLHARSPHTAVDWTTRMDIAIGITRGLHYVHTQENMVHGNLTSGNILLDDHTTAKIADYGLSRLMTPAADSKATATGSASGYHAPELSTIEKANGKTDVYSLGVIMLELLTGKSPRERIHGLALPLWVTLMIHDKWTDEVLDPFLRRDVAGMREKELVSTLGLALRCVNPSPDVRPEVLQVLQVLEEIKQEFAGVIDSATANGGNKPPDEGAGTAGTTYIHISLSSSLDTIEERTATPFEDPGAGNSETSQSDLEEGNHIPIPTPVEEIGQGNSGNEEGNLQASNQGDVDAPPHSQDQPLATHIKATAADSTASMPHRTGDSSIMPSSAQSEGNDGAPISSLNIDELLKATSDGKTGGRTSAEETLATPECSVVSPLLGIDWAKAAIEVHLEVPTSPPLISSDPDLIYQRYFQTLYDLAHRSPPPPFNMLEVQLNKMVMGLQSLGYPLDTWLNAATLALVSAKKREYIEQHVEDYKVNVQAQLEELASFVAPVKEEISRTQTDIATLEQEGEELDETIAKLRHQLALLHGRREEVAESLTTARDQFAVAEAKAGPALVAMDRLKQQHSATSDLRSAMLRELPSVDEVFDSSFREILTKKF